MKKRIYQAKSVKELEKLKLNLEGVERLIFAIDVAKENMYAALKTAAEPVDLTVKWKHSTQSLEVVGWLAGLECRVEVVMEPSGTYGDALRWHLQQAGLRVYQVSPKRVKDCHEIYDGVASTHDAKAAAIIGWLHWQGRSEEWVATSEEERTLAAAVQTLTLYQLPFQQCQNRLEASLARYWPELPHLLELGSATLLELLMGFGGPAQVSTSAAAAGQLMQRIGGNTLRASKVKAVVASSHRTLGMPMLASEVEALQALAAEARRLQKVIRKARRRVESLSQSDPEVQRLGAVVGKATAAVVTVKGGRVTKYLNASCWQKALGLNLKVRSSGQHRGQLKITKRGSSVARKYLYLATLRLVKDEPLARLWYEAKVQRDGGKSRKKALVAVMRKLARALWWVGRGDPFDPAKLFDARRLARAA